MTENLLALLTFSHKVTCLDFQNLKHKNIVLQPGDSMQVEQKGIVDRWQGTEAGVKSLME